MKARVAAERCKLELRRLQPRCDTPGRAPANAATPTPKRPPAPLACRLKATFRPYHTAMVHSVTTAGAFLAPTTLATVLRPGGRGAGAARHEAADSGRPAARPTNGQQSRWRRGGSRQPVPAPRAAGRHLCQLHGARRSQPGPWQPTCMLVLGCRRHRRRPPPPAAAAIQGCPPSRRRRHRLCGRTQGAQSPRAPLHRVQGRALGRGCHDQAASPPRAADGRNLRRLLQLHAHGGAQGLRRGHSDRASGQGLQCCPRSWLRHAPCRDPDGPVAPGPAPGERAAPAARPGRQPAAGRAQRCWRGCTAWWEFGNGRGRGSRRLQGTRCAAALAAPASTDEAPSRQLPRSLAALIIAGRYNGHPRSTESGGWSRGAASAPPRPALPCSLPLTATAAHGPHQPQQQP